MSGLHLDDDVLGSDESETDDELELDDDDDDDDDDVPPAEPLSRL